MMEINITIDKQKTTVIISDSVDGTKDTDYKQLLQEQDS